MYVDSDLLGLVWVFLPKVSITIKVVFDDCLRWDSLAAT